MTLVSEDEVEPIHSAIVRKEAWTLDAVRRLRVEAEKRMKDGPWTVTSDHPKSVDIDPHEYYSEAPYWWPNPENPDGAYIRRDGEINPSRFMSNKAALNSMCDAVLTLGTAAFLLDEPRYSQRAARIIQVWFLNPKTRMNPGLDYAQVIPGVPDGRDAGVLDGRLLIRAIQGMEFLAQTGAWDPKDQAAVHKWFDEYLRWLTESKYAADERRSANYHASWWTAEVAATATFVSDRPATQMAFTYYRDRIFPRQIRADTAPARDDSRARMLAFTAFNLEASTVICRIAQVQNTDLWSVKTRTGATIGAAIDSLQPYLADPHKVSREQIAELQNDSLYLLAFGGMGLKRPDYIALFRKYERPEGAWTCLVDLLVGRWEAAAHQTRH
jgi:hypothetical protein